MESYTKNRQSDVVLLSLIERAFGPDQVPVEGGFAQEITAGVGSTSPTASACAPA